MPASAGCSSCFLWPDGKSASARVMTNSEMLPAWMSAFVTSNCNPPHCAVTASAVAERAREQTRSRFNDMAHPSVLPPSGAIFVPAGGNRNWTLFDLDQHEAHAVRGPVLAERAQRNPRP